MKNRYPELNDFGTSSTRLKGTKAYERRKIWKYVKWVFWFLVVAFIVSLFVSHTIAAQATTKQQRLDQYNKQVQIANGIKQREWVITYKNI